MGSEMCIRDRCQMRAERRDGGCPGRARAHLLSSLQGGELFDRIAECGGLPEDEARRYFLHILSALRNCHQNRVYHRSALPWKSKQLDLGGIVNLFVSNESRLRSCLFNDVIKSV